MNVLKISTGCSAIDKSLDGGFPVKSVGLIYGEAETGKTTLAMQCAVSCARQGYKTLFVDCDGTFSTNRLSQVAGTRLKEVAELVILMRPKNFQEQTAVVDHLTEYLTESFGLVVFDTFTSLYRLRVAESPKKTFEFNRELNRQIALLVQTAKTLGIVLLVTSQVHSVFNDVNVSIEPVATRVLKFWADTIVALKPTENSRVVRAVLEKSPVKAQFSEWHLKIEETGIHDCLIH
jgi:RecA/RadA recombinase